MKHKISKKTSTKTLVMQMREEKKNIYKIEERQKKETTSTKMGKKN